MTIAREMRVRRLLAQVCASSVLALACPVSVFAQDAVGPPPSKSNGESAEDQSIIIVTGNRSIIASLQDVPIEQTYDEQGIACYDVSTVGELLGEIREENGDTDPAFLINGQPVADVGNISDLPVEAIARIETLPRGAAQRVNGAAGQRAYNIVLRKSVKSATITGSHELATDGGWWNDKGEALLTYIQGQDRISLTLRGAKSDALFESERDFVPRAETIPYSAFGNILPATGAEIDPGLSALAGELVSVLALPGGNTLPTLAELISGANRINPSDTSLYRTLRGSSRPYEVALAGNKTLTSWLSVQFNGRASWNESENFSGLPSARFLIPAANAYTPFSVPVYIALNDPTRPLGSSNSSKAQSLSSAFNATFGDWRATLSGRWDSRQQSYVSERTGPLGALSIVDPSANPFSGELANLIPVTIRNSHSKSSTSQIIFDAEGPLVNLWAGPVRGRLGAGASWVRYDSKDSSGSRSFDRHEYLAKLGISVPLTSRQAGFLRMFGDSELTLDVGQVDLGRFGKLNRHSIALEWQALDWLRLVAVSSRDERAIIPELLAAPEVVNVNVPYFDPLTGETVDVTTIYGGAEGLKNEDFRNRSLSLTASPWQKYNLQFEAYYGVDDLRNQIGALPLPSPAVIAAFPDRFQRDSSGTLILVDNRSVNFARQKTERVRLGIRFTVPLSESDSVAGLRPAGGAGRRKSQSLRLQVNASHTILLDGETVIREGLPTIDLLDGGAIGIAGGLQRHTTTASLALTKGKTGIRLEAGRRGESFLNIGTSSAPDRLTFHPLTTVDLKAFADLGQLFAKARLLKDTRFTLSFDNLANDRQRVTNRAGEVPQAYQPVRRDPIGRTVQIELRKVF